MGPRERFTEREALGPRSDYRDGFTVATGIDAGFSLFAREARTQ